MSELIIITGIVYLPTACLVAVLWMASRGSKRVKAGFNVWRFAFYVEADDGRPE